MIIIVIMTITAMMILMVLNIRRSMLSAIVILELIFGIFTGYH